MVGVIGQENHAAYTATKGGMNALTESMAPGYAKYCQTAEFLVKRDIEDAMAIFGAVQNTLANEQQMRWLGPHKGVVHLALAAVTKVCWDHIPQEPGISSDLKAALK